MHKFIVLCPIIILAACDSQEVDGPPTSRNDDDQGVVTYYDRNHDGIVDYEFHNFGCCDRNRALMDVDFNGHYDLQFLWGFAFQKSPIDVVVPAGVTISSEEPDIPSL